MRYLLIVLKQKRKRRKSAKKRARASNSCCCESWRRRLGASNICKYRPSRNVDDPAHGTVFSHRNLYMHSHLRRPQTPGVSSHLMSTSGQLTLPQSHAHALPSLHLTYSPRGVVLGPVAEHGPYLKCNNRSPPRLPADSKWDYAVTFLVHT